MTTDIQIVVKPDTVSWDAIHEVLWKAHSANRERGVTMRYPSLTGDEIRSRIEGKGRMFCALLDDKLVGVAAVVPKETRLWFDRQPTVYAYLCFAGVLSEYAGQGIYRALLSAREQAGLEMGFDRILFDTHEANTRLLALNRENGYRAVDYRFYHDHFNVMMVKWLNGCPSADLRLKCGYALRRFLVRIRHRR